MEIQRGEIWWAELPEPRGSEPGYRRPVLVIQADSFNRSRIQTAIVAAITSNVELAAAPGNVLLPARSIGLPRASVVNVSPLFTLDRSFLSEQAGSGFMMASNDANTRVTTARTMASGSRAETRNSNDESSFDARRAAGTPTTTPTKVQVRLQSSDRK